MQRGWDLIGLTHANKLFDPIRTARNPPRSLLGPWLGLPPRPVLSAHERPPPLGPPPISGIAKNALGPVTKPSQLLRFKKHCTETIPPITGLRSPTPPLAGFCRRPGPPSLAISRKHMNSHANCPLSPMREGGNWHVRKSSSESGDHFLGPLY